MLGPSSTRAGHVPERHDMSGTIPQAVIAVRDATGLPLDVCWTSGLISGVALLAFAILVTRWINR